MSYNFHIKFPSNFYIDKIWEIEVINISELIETLYLGFPNNNVSIRKFSFKDTHRKKWHSNKIPALTKKNEYGHWVVGTSKQLFIRGFYTETKFFKKQSSYWQNSALCDRSIFVLTILFALTLASDMAVLHGNDVFSILVLSTEKRYSCFLKKGFSFPENVFQS